MKNYRVIAAGIAGIVVLIGGILLVASLTTIHPGHVGVSVKKCSGGGVSSDPIPTGYYWRSLFCEEVVEYPTSVQTLVLSHSPHEGMSMDESITVTSSEGLPVNLDVSVSFTLEPAKVPAIYTKYRNDISVIAHNFVRQTIREGLQSIFAQFTAEQLYSTKREESRLEVQAFLSKHLGIEGFVIQQFTVNETRVPEAVVQAINAKVAMIQESQKAEAQVRKTEAEAKQRVAQAQGEAEAKKLSADAEAYFNRTVAASITPEYVQYRALEKWNGELPQMMGTGAVPFVNLGARPAQQPQPQK
ncbi:MAG TPA: prohibitin family protein [Kofleriaceae bacterium]|jgi:regulator of protease activity HflC (stomatin/prohibitin superfamily)|nr:prohibitin family protein [Kofleriaceae bacterium]